MNSSDDFGRTVSAWLHADAEHRVPQHLDAVLRRTRTERQRPAWSSPERWLPMDMSFSRRIAPTLRPAWLLVLAALVLLAVVAAVLASGSRPRLPAPFGTAMPGTIAREEGGDIYLIDPMTKQQRRVTTGPEWDTYLEFSRDGTRLGFLRKGSEGSASAAVMVANADGTGLRSVTEPMFDISSFDWSGDGSSIALVSPIHGVPSVTIVDIERGTSRVLDVDMTADDASWLPPVGREIVFRGRAGQSSAVWAVRPDGSGLRALTPQDGLDDTGYQEPVMSPDGRLLAYTSWDDGAHLVMHVRNVVDGSSWVIPAADRLDDRMTAEFSPDGQRLLHVRSLRDGPPPTFNGVLQLILAPVDGSGPGVPLGPPIPYTAAGGLPDLGFTFSPDGSYVVMTSGAEQQQLWTVPTDGRPATVEPLRGGDLPEIQRVAQ